MPLWYYPLKNEQGQFVKSKLTPDFLSYLDVYKEITGKEPSGPHWKFLIWWPNSTSCIQRSGDRPI